MEHDFHLGDLAVAGQMPVGAAAYLLGDVGDGFFVETRLLDAVGIEINQGDKLSGTDIPLIARIICVADSFDAMNTNRVYRKKLTMDDIIAEIENNKGKQFDPAIADVMLRLLREGKIQ